MAKAKYVTGVIGDCRAAILFPDYVTHADAAACFQGSILGGGFYHYTDDEVIVYGESISLKVRSNPEEDAVLVGLALNHPAYIR